MPLTLRPRETILDVLLSQLLAGRVITDIAPISVIRQLCEGIAASQADLDYDLYALSQSFYLTTAEGADLDIRGLDMGWPRDRGQAASDVVRFTRTTLWVDDIPLPAPQVVQATLRDGSQVLYRSLGNSALLPSGRSTSGPGAATTILAGSTDHLDVNLDADGFWSVTLGTQDSGSDIATAIQAALRARAPHNPAHQPAYDGFRCDYSISTPGAYTLRSGTAGPLSSVQVRVAATADASAALHLGVTQGGQEQVGQDSLDVPVLCDTVGTLGNVGAGQINTQVTPVPGILSVANPRLFSNGREPASDDAHRQDVRSYIKSLGRGCRDALEWAVLHTVGADGQRHVMTAQVAYGVNVVKAFVCDGRSLTVGAQDDVIQDVQDELAGFGSEIGGWVAGGNVAAVASAIILAIDVDVLVLVGATPDLARAQSAITNALYQLLYTAPVGQGMSTMLMDSRIDATTPEVFNIVYSLPLAFSTTPTSTIGGDVGQKVMPGRITVNVQRA